MIIFGIDPGLAHLGVAVADLNPLRFRYTCVVSTEKSDRKRKIRSVDDSTARLQELVRQLTTLMEVYNPAAFACEAPSYPRDAGTAAKIGMSWGAVVALAEACSLPVLVYTPQECKKALCGRISATKDEVQRKLEELYPGIGALWPRGARGGTALIEHAADACSAIHACKDTNEIRLLTSTPGAAKEKTACER